MLTQAELAPDPLEPTSAEVERYVKALQERGDDLARREVWNQIRLAGARAGRRREEAHDSLNRIFRLGSAPSEALDGPYDGILVTTTTRRATDPLFRGLAVAWMPWVVPGAYLGKVLLRRGRDGHWALMGYFALQPAR